MPTAAATGVRARRRESMLALSSVALAMAPKCPLCFLALAGTIGAAAAWIAPITIACLGLTIVTVAKRARLLAIAAAAAILGGRFLLDNKFLVLAGCAALVAASLWRPRKACEEGDCR